tara:strand:+ start:789 stop:1478 length:690 start_codon:yes stop_codon:yes gene_type:complete
MINFKEFYIVEADDEGYFPTVRKAAGAVGSAWENRPRSKERRKIAKGAIKWAQGMAPEYDNMFKPGPDVQSKDLFAGKTIAEIRANVMKWREENINSKDGTPEAAKTLDELMELANLEDIGDTKDVTFSNYPIHWDKKSQEFADKSYGTRQPARDVENKDTGEMERHAAFIQPKYYRSPGHYANTILDSMMNYVEKGYNSTQAIRMATQNFSPDAIEVMRDNGYVYSGH